MRDSIACASVIAALTMGAFADIDHVDLGLQVFGPATQYNTLHFSQESRSHYYIIGQGNEQIVFKDILPGWANEEIAVGFNEGDLIGPELKWTQLLPITIAAPWGDIDCIDQHTDWSVVNKPRFLGVRYDLGNGDYQYAWFRMMALCDGSFSLAGCELGVTCASGVGILDAGIEQEPNKAIIAGDTGCAADMDGDDELTINDFVAFQTLFAIGTPLADCDQDDVLTIDDFVCFQTLYAIGC